MFLLCVLGGLGGELPDAKLPPKSVFPAETPRYPNLWFYVEVRRAPSYEQAVKLVTEHLRRSMRLREYYGPFDNPEGCDFEGRIEHLQPWEERAHRSLQHSHSFHIRYYYTPLVRAGLHRLRLDDGREYWRLAASAHYEVEHTNPNHADVEICPICGRTGEYARYSGNLVEMVHDPLGLELVLTGKIRGQAVKHEDYEQPEVRGMGNLGTYQVWEGATGDRNTLRIGVVFTTAAGTSATRSRTTPAR